MPNFESRRKQTLPWNGIGLLLLRHLATQMPLLLPNKAASFPPPNLRTTPLLPLRRRQAPRPLLPFPLRRPLLRRPSLPPPPHHSIHQRLERPRPWPRPQPQPHPRHLMVQGHVPRAPEGRRPHLLLRPPGLRPRACLLRGPGDPFAGCPTWGRSGLVVDDDSA